jgi:hypothetical protein
LVIYTGHENVKRWIGGWGRRGGFTGEDEHHGGVIEKVARTRDGEFLRAGNLEPDGLTVTHGSDAEPPGFDVDTFIPKARLDSGDGDSYRAGDVEVNEVVTGGGVSYIDGLVADGYRECGGAQFRWNWNRINARGGGDYAGEREHSRQEHTKSTQEART